MRTTTRFDILLDDISRTRSEYELLRISNGSFNDRSELLSRLQTLRAEMATERGARI